MRRFAWLLIALAQPALADEAVVATAANFRPALDHLVEVFERTSAHRITISSGSTGTLYAQIVNGAPFDVFLAADTESPAGLIDAGLAIGESRFTYATGALALFTADRNRLRPSLRETLLQDSIGKLAIANPRLAPYGVAAREVIDAIGATDVLAGKIVMGQNVSQAFSLTQTGNADLGLVALPHVLSMHGGFYLAYQAVPVELHAPIRQDAVLLRHGADNAAAIGFLEFLRGDIARDYLVTLGYGAE